MKIHSFKTGVFRAEQSLLPFVLQTIRSAGPKESQIWVITSKVVSLSENRILSKSVGPKSQVAQNEYDLLLSEKTRPLMGLKFGLPLPWAGVDESNSENGAWILPPKDPFQTAKELHRDLRKELSIQNLGIIISDSLVFPFRKGVVSAAIGYHGFEGSLSSTGNKDLFGRELEITQVNHADSLATAAQILMGEGAEQKPIACIEEAPVIFTEKDQKNVLKMKPIEDLFGPFFEKDI